MQRIGCLTNGTNFGDGRYSRTKCEVGITEGEVALKNNLQHCELCFHAEATFSVLRQPTKWSFRILGDIWRSWGWMANTLVQSTASRMLNASS